MNKGILVVSFGTTYGETREKNIEKVVRTVSDRFPDCEVWQAYSSNKVRKILKERDGITIPDTAEALKEMMRKGIRQVTILPTHIIDGVENHKMQAEAEKYRQNFDRLKIAGALLEKEEDYRNVAKAIWESLAADTGEDSVILMGHGSSHEADASYEKMERALREYSDREIYIATVEGRTAIEDVIKKIKNKKTPVLLTPFMLVAGDHAVNDMAGETDSFYTKLMAAGFEVRCLLKGIGEYKAIRELYIEHLQQTFR